MTSTSFGPTKTATVNGTSLAYREHGNGEPVVFVHGGVSDLRIWENQLPVVGRSFRAIAYSRRYSRPNLEISPDVPDPWIPHVDDLAIFLKEIGAAPAHLVGSSQGAFISLLVAVRYPELVQSLMLEEPPTLSLLVSYPPRVMELLRLTASRPRTAIALMRFLFGTVARATRAFERGEDSKGLEIFMLGVLGAESLARLPAESAQRAFENISTLRANLLNGIDFPSLEDDEVRAIRVPVLLVTGELSPQIHLRTMDRLEELLPRAESVEIPGASHIMHEENPAALNAALLRFLASAARTAR